MVLCLTMVVTLCVTTIACNALRYAFLLPTEGLPTQEAFQEVVVGIG